MLPVNAVFVRMNILREEMDTVSEKLYLEIHGLRERVSGLHVSWEGEAFNVYYKVLTDDLALMEVIAMNAVMLSRLLGLALGKYGETEMRSGEAIGRIH